MRNLFSRVLGIMVVALGASGIFVWYKKSVNKTVQDVEKRFAKKDTASIGRTVETFYGSFYVDEPVLLSLLDSKEMQRIKKVYQYGPSYFLRDYKDTKKHYTRYSHCVGVWALLRKFGAPLDEQIAGMLHDASHTVFSHTGDYLFHHKSFKKSYQDNIHSWYLKKGTVPEILRKHGFSFEDVIEKGESRYNALEQQLPDICADRLEYNLYGGYMEGLLTKEDVDAIVNDIRFEGGKWYFTTAKWAKTFAEVPLHLMIKEWGGPEIFLNNAWLSEALKRAMAIGLVSRDEVHFSTDDVIWKRLKSSKDRKIKKFISRLERTGKLFSISNDDKCDFHVKTKFRGIDPLVKDGGSLKRLTHVDADFAKQFNARKEQTMHGWKIVFADSVKGTEKFLHSTLRA